MHEVGEFASHSHSRTTELYFVRKEEDAEPAASRIQIHRTEFGVQCVCWLFKAPLQLPRFPQAFDRRTSEVHLPESDGEPSVFHIGAHLPILPVCYGNFDLVAGLLAGHPAALSLIAAGLLIRRLRQGRRQNALVRGEIDQPVAPADGVTAARLSA
jgi:hypothetical protein